jgi:hypothetical protein
MGPSHQRTRRLITRGRYVADDWPIVLGSDLPFSLAHSQTVDEIEEELRVPTPVTIQSRKLQHAAEEAL